MAFFSELKSPQFSEFAEKLQLAHEGGELYIGVFTLSPGLEGHKFNGALRPLLDEFSKSRSLKQIGESWDEVPKETAEWILREILNRSLAYGTEIMPRTTATDFVHKFLKFCIPDSIKDQRQ